MNKVFLTGASGRLGTSVSRRLSARWDISPCAGRRGCDLSVSPPASVVPAGTMQVLNCAALSSRSQCSADPFGAFAVNSRWPARLAGWCREEGLRLIHVSTDLVYAGGVPPYTEASPCVPKSLYGWTKLLGDLAVMRRAPDALVVRTSVLVGQVGAQSHTFSEDILSGRANTFFVDSFRNHTDIFLLADWLGEALASDRSGLVLAAAPYSESRMAYASSLLGPDSQMDQAPVPAHLPGDLTLQPSVRIV